MFIFSTGHVARTFILNINFRDIENFCYKMFCSNIRKLCTLDPIHYSVVVKRGEQTISL